MHAYCPSPHTQIVIMTINQIWCFWHSSLACKLFPNPCDPYTEFCLYPLLWCYNTYPTSVACMNLPPPPPHPHPSCPVHFLLSNTTTLTQTCRLKTSLPFLVIITLPESIGCPACPPPLLWSQICSLMPPPLPALFWWSSSFLNL